MSSSIKGHSVTKAKLNLFSHVKYEHLVAGISGGVTSTLILHPLDLIKIRFAGKNLSLQRHIKKKLNNDEQEQLMMTNYGK